MPCTYLEIAQFCHKLNRQSVLPRFALNHRRAQPVCQIKTNVKVSEKQMQADKAQLLVVDDDETNRMVVQLLMEMRGYDVRQAASGAECLKMIQQYTFDAILMDLSMPQMDGFETVRQIKATHSLNSDTVIYALTAHTTLSDTEKCKGAGMRALIAKPFDSDRADYLESLLVSQAPNSLN